MHICCETVARKRVWLWIGVAATLAPVVALAALAPHLLTLKREHAAERAAVDHAASGRESARLRVVQRPRAGRLPSGAAASVRTRRADVVALEAAITRDARARVAAGSLDGPVRETLCGPLERVTHGTRLVRTGDEADLRRRIGRYDCIAVLRDVVEDGRVVAHFGHAYVGAIDFATGAYVVCLAIPHMSERGTPLATAPVPRACVNAHGAREQGGFDADARDTRTPLPLLAHPKRSPTPST
jgi:hypothetical protein